MEKINEDLILEGVFEELFFTDKNPSVEHFLKVNTKDINKSGERFIKISKELFPKILNKFILENVYYNEVSHYFLNKDGITCLNKNFNDETKFAFHYFLDNETVKFVEENKEYFKFLTELLSAALEEYKREKTYFEEKENQNKEFYSGNLNNKIPKLEDIKYIFSINEKYNNFNYRLVYLFILGAKSFFKKSLNFSTYSRLYNSFIDGINIYSVVHQTSRYNNFREFIDKFFPMIDKTYSDKNIEEVIDFYNFIFYGKRKCLQETFFEYINSEKKARSLKIENIENMVYKDPISEDIVINSFKVYKKNKDILLHKTNILFYMILVSKILEIDLDNNEINKIEDLSKAFINNGKYIDTICLSSNAYNLSNSKSTSLTIELIISCALTSKWSPDKIKRFLKELNFCSDKENYQLILVKSFLYKLNEKNELPLSVFAGLI